MNSAEASDDLPGNNAVVATFFNENPVMHDLNRTMRMIDDLAGIGDAWKVVGVGTRNGHCDS
jgi:hypothetical protein